MNRMKMKARIMLSWMKVSFSAMWEENRMKRVVIMIVLRVARVKQLFSSLLEIAVLEFGVWCLEFVPLLTAAFPSLFERAFGRYLMIPMFSPRIERPVISPVMEISPVARPMSSAG